MADETGMDNDIYQQVTRLRDPCPRCGLDHLPPQDNLLGSTLCAPDSCIRELGDRVRALEAELYRLGASAARTERMARGRGK